MASATPQTFMDTATALVETKTRELCAALVQLPDFAETYRKYQAFMEDELAKFEWQMVNDRGMLLQQKEAAGLPMEPAELGEFDGMRDRLLEKPVVREFIEAQQALAAMQKLVFPMLNKTFELGRVPVPEDFLNDLCDSTCGMH
jgi:cell fate (sporulation/competence/biofilm development) regulator YlbF (YheA/YmcA/DUF963 family)